MRVACTENQQIVVLWPMECTSHELDTRCASKDVLCTHCTGGEGGGGISAMVFQPCCSVIGVVY